ncbi:MAG: NB-ARC domain-containing protein, partial [Xenococcaceae cyanobacterium]
MANLHQRSKRKRGVTLSPIGWQRLQSAQETSARKANHRKPYTLEDLNEITGLSPHTLTKIRRRKAPVDKRSLEDYFSAFNLTLTLSDYLKPTSATQIQKEKIIPIQQDWGEALDVSIFYGRIKELATLEKWIKIDRCRLVAVLGMGGIGKTALAVKIAQQLQEQFEYVIWRSLRNAPPLENLLGELISFLSEGQETQVKIKVLIQYLRSSRSLIILDNVETILQPGECAGQYRTGYENYGQLFKLIGETAHSSCLMLTSREKPAEVAALEGIDLSVHSLQLTGSLSAAKALLEAKGLSGSEAQQQQLCARYGNNPLALKIVATSIQDLFAGDIGAFLAEDVTVFNSIQKLLERQFERLSPLEQTIMYWLAINREWTTIAELLEDIVPAVSRGNLLEAL